MNERRFRSDVCAAWEGIARDCGSLDGEGAGDHIEEVFFALADSVDADLQERVERFDPELKRIALDELKRYG